MKHRCVETDTTNEEVEHCIVGVGVNACPRSFGITEKRFWLENYKYRVQPLGVPLWCIVRFVLVCADCALSRGAKVHRGSLTWP